MKNISLTPLSEIRFLSIAHRGASRYAPENTMAAFEMAYQMKADMIELDVQLSKDGVPVVFHDTTVEKRSNGRGAVSSFLFNELRQLDAGKWFSIEFMGEKIPALGDVLQWADGKIRVNIEIKPAAVRSSGDNGIEEKVLRLVYDSGMQKQVIVSSFDYGTVERIKKISPGVLTGLLYNKKESRNREPVTLLNDYGADFFHCSKTEMGKKWIKQLKEAEKNFLIYTVNNRKSMLKWLQNGAYGVFSDKPDELKEAAGNFFNSHLKK